MSYAERIGAIRHLGYAMADAVLGAAQIASEADDVIAAKDAEIASLIAANGDLQRWFDAAFSEFGRKDAEIARLREALGSVVEAADTAPPIHVIAYISRAVEKARAALAQAAEVGNG